MWFILGANEKREICFTNTYQKRKFSKTPRIVTYVDGPFFPDESLDRKEKQADLRNRVYKAMCERSKMNTVELIKYIKVEENQDQAENNSSAASDKEN